jgi:hypothetical protein
MTSFVYSRRSTLLAAMPALLLAAGCAHAPDAAAGPVLNACTLSRIPEAEADMRLPFEIVRGRVYVQARVNGTGPHTFAIDTGASGLGRADASLTAALGLEVTGAATNSDGVAVASADTVHLDSLDLGGLVRTDLDVITRDYSSKAPAGAEIAGIAGRDFFADGLLVIDFPARTVSFSRSRTIPADAPGALAYERPFRVPVVIGERVVEANLDTGAGATMVFPRALYDSVAGGPLEAAGQGSLSNTTISLERGLLHGPVRIGDVTVSDIEVRVSDEFPELFVGADVLQHHVLAFDQRTRRVAVCPVGS